MNKERIRFNILEVCSESEYGSWEFWSGLEKTEANAQLITEIISTLVKEKKIFPTEYRFFADRSYQEVPLDEDRLRKEIIQSIRTEDVNPDTYYWFLATDQGEKEYNEKYKEMHI